MSDLNATFFKDINPDLDDFNKKIKKSSENTKLAVTEIEKLYNKTKDLQELMTKAGQTTGNLAKKNKELSEAEKKAAEVAKQAAKVKKEQEKAAKALQKQRDKGLAQLAKLEDKERKLEAALRMQVKTEEQAVMQNNALAAARRKVDVTTEKGKKAVQTLNKQIDRNNKLIAQNADKLKKQKIGIGSYTKSVLKAGVALAGAFGATLGLRAVVGAFGDIIKKGRDFEASMSKVKAVSGATDDQFGKLRANAKLLGESTEKTATEVSGLQLELSKLGLTPKEILKSTGAILDLSTAAGSDLAQSAKVAAATMKGFGLQADDVQRITDVMAKSFSSSALDLSKFETAMSALAPVAKNANVSLEESTAQLSLLVDRGLDASTAGSSLRNIYLDLSKKGLTLNEALDKIQNSTDKNATAMDLFGKRGATTATILAGNRKEADRLTKTYENAAGATAEMAAIMRDNLQGDADKAASAIEGLSLNLFDRLNPALRNSVQGFTGFVGKVNEYLKVPLSDKIIEEQVGLNLLFDDLVKTAEGTEERTKAVEELQKMYPDYIANIDLQTASEADLKKELKDVNNELVQRFIQQSQQEKIEAKARDLAEAKIELAESEAKVRADLIKIAIKQGKSEEIVGKTLAEQRQILGENIGSYNRYRVLAGKVTNAQFEFNKITKESQSIIDLATKSRNGNTEAVEKNTSAEDKAAIAKIEAAEIAASEAEKEAERNKNRSAEAEKERLKSAKATAKILQSEVDLFIAKNQSIIANEDILTQELIDLEADRLNAIAEKRNEIVEFEKANKIKTDTEAAKATLDIQNETNNKIIDNQKKLNDQLEKAEEERQNKISEDAAKASKEIADNLSKRTLALQLKLAQGVLTEKEFNQAVIEASNEAAQAQIDNLEFVLLSEELSADKTLEIETKLAEARKALDDNLAQQKIDNATKTAENQKKLDAEQAAANEESFNKAIQVANGLFEFRRQILENEIAEIDASRDSEIEKEEAKLEKQLENTTLSEEQREELRADSAKAIDGINKKSDAEANKLRRKQAVLDKAQAIFNIGINTARAIVAALTIPPPAGPILAGVNAALGAVQLGIVAAKPLPAFEKGGTVKETGNIKVSEKGIEGMISPSGDFSFTPEKESVIHAEKGTQIIDHNKTMALMNGMLTSSTGDKQTDMQLLEAMKNIKKSIDKKPVNSGSALSEYGFNVVSRQRSDSVKYENQRYRHNGS